MELNVFAQKRKITLREKITIGKLAIVVVRFPDDLFSTCFATLFIGLNIRSTLPLFVNIAYILQNDNFFNDLANFSFPKICTKQCTDVADNL